jgi:hypothetical protein
MRRQVCVEGLLRSPDELAHEGRVRVATLNPRHSPDACLLSGEDRTRSQRRKQMVDLLCWPGARGQIRFMGREGLVALSAIQPVAAGNTG